MQNEPNLHPRRGIGGASPTRQRGTIAPNKPNLPHTNRHRCRLGGAQIPPGGVNRAKRTQFSGGVFEMQVHTGKGVRMNLACKSPRENEANSSIRDCRQTCGGTAALRPAKCAKQTQLPAVGIPHYATVLSFHHPCPISTMENEPNSQEPSAGRGGPIAQNEPNLVHPRTLRACRARRSQFRVCGRRSGIRYRMPSTPGSCEQETNC